MSRLNRFSPCPLLGTDGLGYVLTVIRHVPARTGDNGGDDVLDAVGSIVRKHIPGAHLLSRAGDEESYRLSGSASHQFSTLLRALDQAGCVRTCGMQITTLEEVFIRLASTHTPAGSGKPMPAIAATDEEDEWKAFGRQPLAAFDSSAADSRRFTVPVPQHSVFRQSCALLRKRLLVALRSPLAFFIQQTLPVLFVYFVLKGVSPSATPVGIQPRPPLELSSRMFNNHTACFAGICKTKMIPSELVHTAPVTPIQRALLRDLNSSFDFSQPVPEPGESCVQDSEGLGRYLLNTTFEHGWHKRFSALAFNDSVTVRVKGDMLQIAQLRAAGVLLSHGETGHDAGYNVLGEILSTLDFAERYRSINVTTYEDVRRWVLQKRKTVDDMIISGGDCDALSLTPLQCERLTARVERQHSRHDVDDDGDVDAEDYAEALAMVSDGDITFEECLRLELQAPTRARCILLMNMTELDWSRRDIDNDGDVDREDSNRHASLLADFTLGPSECKLLELDDKLCSFYRGLVSNADCRRLKLNSTACSKRKALLEEPGEFFDFDKGLHKYRAKMLEYAVGFKKEYTFSDCPTWAGDGGWIQDDILCATMKRLFRDVRNSSDDGITLDRDDAQRLASVMSGMLRAIVTYNPNITERFSPVLMNNTNVTESSYQWHTMKAHVPMTIMHNTSYPHAAAAAVADATAAAWKHAHHGNTPATYRVVNHPLPPPKTPFLDFRQRGFLAVLLAFFLSVPLSYMPAAAGTLVTTERTCQAAHVQLVSGAPAWVYWLSHFLADLVAYFLGAALVLILFYAREEDAFIASPEQTLATLVLLLSFGAASIPMMHLLSKSFDSAPTSQIGCILFNLFTSYGLNLVNRLSWLTHFGMFTPFGHSLVLFLNGVYRLFPMFSLSTGLERLAASWIQCDYINDVYGAWGIPNLLERCLDPFKYITDIIRRLPYLPSVCFVVLCLVERPRVVRTMLRRIGRIGAPCLGWIDGSSYVDSREARKGENLVDDDVREERRRVASGSTDAPPQLTIREMSKAYPPRGRSPAKMAVQRLDLIIERGECFGLLGVNGAGKTTTLSVLTGGTLPSAGSAAVDGFDVVDEQREVFQRIGYCPQENPLLGQLTAQETLTLYADLRGVSADAVSTHVTRLLAQVGLTADADRQCGTLSGGTKRKLSLAIALVGSPALLLLDEPSCGLDPVSRRQIWDVVLELRPTRSIMLTTHSMEESEALCTRVGVMVTGRLRCIGGIQHLKSKYGSGYMVELICPHRIGSSDSLVDGLRSLRGVFSNTRLVEDNGYRLRLMLPPNNVSRDSAGGSSYQLADVFDGLQDNADRLGITEYAATQSTLESVFLAVVDATERSSQDDHTLIIDPSASGRGAYDRAIDESHERIGWQTAAGATPLAARGGASDLELM